MPYIKQTDRAKLKDLTGAMSRSQINNSGELNYLITYLVHHYLGSKDKTGYQDYNDVMGALAGAQMELYRNNIAGYEDDKREENGPVGLFEGEFE